MSRNDSRAKGADDLTLWDRIAHTPLGDAIRREWKRRLTVSRILREASLSPGIVDLVQRIIREARLWRSERLDVARELAAHFADALESGRSEDEIIASFGDPSQAARLIRSAKKRNRPLWWRASRNTLRGTATLLALVTVLYIALAIRFFAGSPTISHNYLDDLNHIAAAVPEDERAWPIYRQALLALEDLPPELVEEDPWSGMPLSEQYIAYLQRNAHTFDLLRQAAAKPNMGFVLDYTLSEADQNLWPQAAGDPEVGLITVPLPYLATLSTAARLLNADALRAAHEGNAAMSLRNINAVLAIAQHIREHPILITDLVAISIYTTALDTVGALLETHSKLFSDHELTSLVHTIAASHGGDVRVRIEGERIWFRDFLQRTYTDDGRGGGRLTPQGVRFWTMITGTVEGDDRQPVEELLTWSISPAAGMLSANRRNMLAKYDEMLNKALADAALPLWQRTFAMDRQVEELKTSSRYMPIAVLFPALSQAMVRGDLAAQRRDGILVAIALELHQRRHGAYPDSLDVLAPHLLPTVPLDRFDGKPLRYIVRDDRPIVYSVGTNREDNGGVPAIGRRGYPGPDEAMRWISARHVPSMVPDGDWILWPRLPANWEDTSSQPDATSEADHSGD